MHISTLRRSRPLEATSLPVLLLQSLLFASSAAAFASAAPASKSPDADLICHTSDPNDCYPRIFVPTDEFQTVHDDQEIPPGLHVRMDINTGLKQAKINVPDQVDSSLEGLPVDRSVVVVDAAEAKEAEASQVPKAAPAYDSFGKIKEPPQHHAGTFQHSLDLLKGEHTDTPEFNAALESLEDISHDIYYGLKIAEDRAAVRTLLCLMVEASDMPVPEGITPQDQQAALILAGTLSNNPKALKEVAKNWDTTMLARCPHSESLLMGSLYWSLIQSAATHPPTKLSSSQTKAKVAAISHLIKDDAIRARYLRDGGMKQILEVLTVSDESKGWESARRRAGQLVLDSFLDEDMGAKLGEWPTVGKLGAEVCEREETKKEEGCWDYHVERIKNSNKKDKTHWSQDLHERLVKVRMSQAEASLHAEL